MWTTRTTAPVAVVVPSKLLHDDVIEVIPRHSRSFLVYRLFISGTVPVMEQLRPPQRKDYWLLLPSRIWLNTRNTRQATL
jgi:hypothetical protein